VDIETFLRGLLSGVIGLGSHIYTDSSAERSFWKARVISSDTSRGSSAGYRVIYGIRLDENRDKAQLHMLFVYHKSRKKELSSQQYKEIKEFTFEFSETLWD